MAAARRRWPNALFVIDKRHLLQTLDRDLLTQAANVILGRQDRAGDLTGTKQAVKTFGLKAYPYLALRSLVLRRQSNLTPADLATWALLRREGGAAQVLWEAYQWRETLYDLYSASLSTQVIEQGLNRWRDGLRTWQKQHLGEGEHYYGAPLGRIRWATETYWQECLNYATAGATNAATELINAEVRRFVRRGHRYAPETVMLLVNRALTIHTGMSPVVTPFPLVSEHWVRAASVNTNAVNTNAVNTNAVNTNAVNTVSQQTRLSLPIKRSLLPELDLPLPEPNEPAIKNIVARVPRPSRKPNSQTATSSSRRPRLLPQQASAINLPPTVWMWLHSTITPGQRLGERWGAVILREAPESERAIWQLLCAGQTVGWEMPEATAAQLQLWRVTVLCHYLCACPEILNASERLRQPRLRGLNLAALHKIDPRLTGELDLLWQTLSRERFRSLLPSEKTLLDIVELWHRLRADKALITQLLEFRTGQTGNRHLWDVWRQAAVQQGETALVLTTMPTLEKISLIQLSALLVDPAFRWATALEWQGVQAKSTLNKYSLNSSQRVAALTGLQVLIKRGV